MIKLLTFGLVVNPDDFTIKAPFRAAALRLCSADDDPNFAITPTVSPIMRNVNEAPTKTIYFKNPLIRVKSYLLQFYKLPKIKRSRGLSCQWRVPLKHHQQLKIENHLLMCERFG